VKRKTNRLFQTVLESIHQELGLGGPARARAGARPGREVLEDRLTPANFSPTPGPDGTAGNTLRADVIAANTAIIPSDTTFTLAAGVYHLTLGNGGIQTGDATKGELALAGNRLPPDRRATAAAAAARPARAAECTSAARPSP
jgi:hypothetical protein